MTFGGIEFSGESEIARWKRERWMEAEELVGKVDRYWRQIGISTGQVVNEKSSELVK